MRLGFDEIYVVAKNETALWCETIYDYKRACDLVENLKKTGYDKAEVITLEYAFENGYLSG